VHRSTAYLPTQQKNTRQGSQHKQLTTAAAPHMSAKCQPADESPMPTSSANGSRGRSSVSIPTRTEGTPSSEQSPPPNSFPRKGTQQTSTRSRSTQPHSTSSVRASSADRQHQAERASPPPPSSVASRRPSRHVHDHQGSRSTVNQHTASFQSHPSSKQSRVDRQTRTVPCMTCDPMHAKVQTEATSLVTAQEASQH
jgi:hypothetical protein